MKLFFEIRAENAQGKSVNGKFYSTYLSALPGAVTDLVKDDARTTESAFFVKWTKPAPGATQPVSVYQVTITDVVSGTEILKKSD